MNAITLYRIGYWSYTHRIPLVPKVCSRLILLFFGSVVPSSCVIGQQTQFAYGGIGVILHAECRIGDNVMIGPQTTLGGNFGTGAPIVGNNVYLAPGARILGGVRVGNNVVVGANAVVTRDVPDNCIVGGVPARILRHIHEGALDALQGILRREENVSPIGMDASASEQR